MRLDYSSTVKFRQENNACRSLHARGKDGLKMRALLFPRDNADFNLAKTGFFQKFVQTDLAEAEPVVGVKLARLFETMTEEIEHNDASIFFQNSMRRFDRAFRFYGVMQSLTQNSKIDTVLGNRRVLDITQPILQVLKAVFARKFCAELDHLWRIVDRDHFARAFSQQLRKRPLSGTQVGHRQWRQQRDEGVSERFPRAPRNI